MKSSILLLDPYRSALLAMGLNERMLASPRGVDYTKSSTHRLGSDAGLQSTVLNFAMLYDDLSIVQHENRGQAEELNAQGLLTLSALPLQDMGIVRLTDRNVAPPWNNAVATPKSYEEFWHAIKSDLESLEPILVSYLVAKGVVPHPLVYQYVRDQRLGGSVSVSTRLENVPPEYIDIAVFFAKHASGTQALDFFVFTSLSELLEAEEEVTATGCAVAQPIGSVAKTFGGNTAEGANQVVEIVVDELLVDGFELPVPRSLDEARTLRQQPDMQSFRRTFQPWVESLAEGRLADELKLRTEVKAHCRAFRNSPRVKRISDILAYVSLPVGLIDLVTPTFGAATVAGTALGIAGIGLPMLAERWQKKGRWVSVCRNADSLRRL